jgi:hypothetical protein
MPTIVKDMPPPEQAGTEPTNERYSHSDGHGNHNHNHGTSSSSVNVNANASANNANAISRSGTSNSNSNSGSGGGPPASSVATLSSPWEFDDVQPWCSTCRDEFNPLNRRHHCRLCGKIYCGKCTNQRALIPPSSIVLVPDGGKKAKPQMYSHEDNANAHDYANAHHTISFEPDPDPDRMLTYLDEQEQLLYGKGLEERFLLAREPQRTCHGCYEQLQPLQEELRNSNSNSMRFNHVDPTSPARLWNSPLAFTLGHEVRKAAYTLNNLLPLPKRMGSVVCAPPRRNSHNDSNNNNDDNDNDEFGRPTDDLQQCKEQCSTLSPQLANLDGVHIPARLLTEAKGVAVLTVVKGGFGLAGVEFGTGLVVARLGDHWSAPCAIGTAGLSWGGKQIVDMIMVMVDIVVMVIIIVSCVCVVCVVCWI